MATPFVAGTAALLLSADPTLTPDQVKAILTQTASQMPGFSEFEVGAGYINVYAAVDKVYHRGKPYGAYGGPLDLQAYNLSIATNTVSQTPFHIDYNPVATPGAGSANSTTFTVSSGISVLDVFGTIDDSLGLGEGNTVGMLLTAPNGTVYSSGIALPVLDAPSREVVVKNPIPGTWRLEVRGVRGLAALPEVSLPTSGAALPGPVDGSDHPAGVHPAGDRGHPGRSGAGRDRARAEEPDDGRDERRAVPSGLSGDARRLRQGPGVQHRAAPVAGRLPALRRRRLARRHRRGGGRQRLHPARL